MARVTAPAFALRGDATRSVASRRRAAVQHPRHRVSADNDGAERTQQGDPELALSLGRRALTGGRKSLPSLSMVTRELTGLLADRYAGNPETTGYLEQIRVLQASWPDIGLAAPGARPEFRQPQPFVHSGADPRRQPRAS
jgi:hypothetical protein